MKNKIIEILLKYPIIFYSIYFVYILRPAFKNLYPKELDFLINGFSGVLLIWGLIIIIYNMKIRGNIYTKKNILFIVGWILASILSSLSNYKYITFSSAKTTLLTVFSIIVFLPAYTILKEKYSKLEMFKYIFYPVFISKFIIDAISVILYLGNISIFLIKGNALSLFGLRYVFVSKGKYTPLLYGLYDDPNFLAMIDTTLIFTAIYILILGYKKINTFEKVLIGIFIVIEFITVALCNSRGTLYSIIFIAGLAMILAIKKDYIINKSKGINILKSLGKLKTVKLLVTLLVLIGSYYGIQKTSAMIFSKADYKRYVFINNENLVRISESELNYVDEVKKNERWIGEYKPISDDLYDDENGEYSENPVIETLKEDTGKDIGNGRVKIWKEAFNLFLKKPIFGISPKAQMNVARANYSEVEFPFMTKGKSIHNSYMATILYYGLFGSVILLVWLSFTMIPIVKDEFKNRYLRESVLLFSVLFIFAVSFFLEAIFLNNYYEQTYLMFIIGFLTTEYSKVR